MTEPEPVPHLRRDPNPSTASGRKVLIGVAVFFVLLLAFVLTLVFTIGLHNNGVKPPPSTAGTTPATAELAPPAFFAITTPNINGTPTGATAYVSDGGTYAFRPPHEHVTAIGVAPSDRVAYAAYRLPGCRTGIESIRYFPRFDHGVGLVRGRVGKNVISGRIMSIPMAVSPDGTMLALAVVRASPHGATCSRSAIAEIYDLETHRVVGSMETVVRRGPTSFAWEPGNAVDLLTGGYVLKLFADQRAAPVVLAASHPGVRAILWWHGALAEIGGGAMRSVRVGGLGTVLGTGIPQNVETVSVDATGSWLLLTAGSTTYEWHDGHATKVAGNWIQPAW